MAAIFEETVRLVFFKWLGEEEKLIQMPFRRLAGWGMEAWMLYLEWLIVFLILLSLLESSNPDVANLLPKTTLKQFNLLGRFIY